MSLDASLVRLSAKRLLPVGLGDQNVAGSKCGSIEADFTVWKASLLEQLLAVTSDHKPQNSSMSSATEGSATQVMCACKSIVQSARVPLRDTVETSVTNCRGH